MNPYREHMGAHGEELGAGAGEDWSCPCCPLPTGLGVLPAQKGSSGKLITLQ